MQELAAPGVSTGELPGIPPRDPSHWGWGSQPCRGWGQWPEKSHRTEGPSLGLGDISSCSATRWVRVHWSWCFRERFRSLVWAGFGDETRAQCLLHRQRGTGTQRKSHRILDIVSKVSQVNLQGQFLPVDSVETLGGGCRWRCSPVDEPAEVGWILPCTSEGDQRSGSAVVFDWQRSSRI